MALTLPRVDRKYRTYLVTAVDEDGIAFEPTEVALALTDPYGGPVEDTAWFPTDRLDGARVIDASNDTVSSHDTFDEAVAARTGDQRVATRWRVLLAGPDAVPLDAVVVPAEGAAVWLQIVDTPEIDSAKVDTVGIV